MKHGFDVYHVQLYRGSVHHTFITELSGSSSGCGTGNIIIDEYVGSMVSTCITFNCTSFFKLNILLLELQVYKPNTPDYDLVKKTLTSPLR